MTAVKTCNADYFPRIVLRFQQIVQSGLFRRWSSTPAHKGMVNWAIAESVKSEWWPEMNRSGLKEDRICRNWPLQGFVALPIVHSETISVDSSSSEGCRLLPFSAVDQKRDEPRLYLARPRTETDVTRLQSSRGSFVLFFSPLAAC